MVRYFPSFDGYASIAEVGSTSSDAAMSLSSEQLSIKLSVCMTTLNRASFIGDTLESILGQLTDSCELVVIDAASTDETGAVVADYARRFSRLRYIRQETNNGLDRDYDHAVAVSRGEYCWLMTDDDLLKPGAIEAVLDVLRRGVSLVVVNVESRDSTMSRIRQRRWADFDVDQSYSSKEMDRLFADTDQLMRYIGCIVIDRDLWLKRERASFYGSWFLFAGVIFQACLPRGAVLISEPLISYRMSNTHSWTNSAEILLSIWPSLIEKLPLSDAAKCSVQSAQPWKHFIWLLFMRALGLYSWKEYRRWIRPRLRRAHQRVPPGFAALVPCGFANIILVVYYALYPCGTNGPWLEDSQYHWRKWVTFGCSSRSSEAG
jgi:glycosyltransferase involved in cell wall biosynthesis